MSFLFQNSKIRENIIKDLLENFKNKKEYISYSEYDFNDKNEKLVDAYLSTPEGISFLYNDQIYLKLNTNNYSPGIINYPQVGNEDSSDKITKIYEDIGYINSIPSYIEHDIHFFGSSILISLVADSPMGPQTHQGTIIIPSDSKLYKNFQITNFSFVVVTRNKKAFKVTYKNFDLKLISAYQKYCEIAPKFEFKGFIEDKKYFLFYTLSHQELWHAYPNQIDEEDECSRCNQFLTYFDGEYSRIGDDDEDEPVDESVAESRKQISKLNLSPLTIDLIDKYFNAFLNYNWLNKADSTSLRNDWYTSEHLKANPTYVSYQKFFFSTIKQILDNEKDRKVFIKDLIKLNNVGHGHVFGYHGLIHYVNMVLILYHSEFGLYLPSFDSNTGEIVKTRIKISLDETGNNLFYNIFANEVPLIDLHHVYSGNEYLNNLLIYRTNSDEYEKTKRISYYSPDPLEQPEEIDVFDKIGLDGDVDKSKQLCDDLINEASNNKIWTIPYKALVDITFGDFSSITLSEFKNKIFFLLNHIKNISFFGSLNVDTKEWEIKLVTSRDDPPGLSEEEQEIYDKKLEKKEEEAKLSIKLLIASLIRDFWVVETRESVFNFYRKNVKRKVNGEKVKQLVIKYIPRVKYTKKLNVFNTDKELSFETRRAHWVTPHLRKLSKGNASDFRAALAKTYGFTIKPGFTFVKPFEKGGLKGKNVIFRSKSATKLLFNQSTKILPSEHLSDWFKFEVDVNNWLQKNDFTVEHTGGSGDGGKDIIATKNIGDQIKTYYIECKCWSNPVGVEVPRKLLGTLTDEYPPNTEGVIMTTSNFTQGASEFAKRNGITLIDNENLFRSFN